VHLPSFIAGKSHFAPATPRFFSPNCLDFDFAAGAPEPHEWRKFLGQLWPNDPDSIGTLQEWFGLCLAPDTTQQKILTLIGPKRSGKGTIARVLRALVGSSNVAGPTLSGLGAHFGLWPLLGKTVAIISDARLSGRTDAATVVERLLSISGEDALTIDRKNLSPVTAQLLCRFVVLTNELPSLRDASGALPSRLIVLPLSRSWYGQEDTTLTSRLLGELPGILLWAIEVWRRLRDRGYFVQPASGKEMLGEIEALASPVGAFVATCCVTGPACEVERSELFGAWKNWCEHQGREHPGDAATFGRNLRAAVPAIRGAQRRMGNDRVHVYQGIRIKQSADAAGEEEAV
jgi:putative DNA primase/helicase